PDDAVQDDQGRLARSVRPQCVVEESENLVPDPSNRIASLVVVCQPRDAHAAGRVGPCDLLPAREPLTFAGEAERARIGPRARGSEEPRHDGEGGAVGLRVYLLLNPRKPPRAYPLLAGATLPVSRQNGLQITRGRGRHRTGAGSGWHAIARRKAAYSIGVSISSEPP